MIQLRPSNADDLDFLKEMLFEAYFWDSSIQRPLFAAFCDNAEFTKLLTDWGRKGDRAVIADDDGSKSGAAWFRLWTAELHSYGFVDATTPEIAIAVRADYRSKGVGRRLLDALIQTARDDGFPALSLSVNPQNRARQLYESAGFRKVGESGTSWTLLLALSSHGGTPAELPKHALLRTTAGHRGWHRRASRAGPPSLGR